MNLCWVKDRNRILLEEKRGRAWSFAAVWKLVGVRNTLKKFGRRGYQTRITGLFSNYKLENEMFKQKWLNVNNEVVCMKMLRCSQERSGEKFRHIFIPSQV